MKTSKIIERVTKGRTTGPTESSTGMTITNPRLTRRTEVRLRRIVKTGERFYSKTGTVTLGQKSKVFRKS